MAKEKFDWLAVASAFCDWMAEDQNGWRLRLMAPVRMSSYATMWCEILRKSSTL